jgi:predicted nucleotidyltransferase
VEVESYLPNSLLKITNGMKNLEEIKAKLRSNKKLLFSEYPLKSLAIFGSFSRNENRPDSDIDLLVDFSKPIGICFIDLADEIESLLNVSVDLVSRNGIKEKYYKVIQEDLIHV